MFSIAEGVLVFSLGHHGGYPQLGNFSVCMEFDTGIVLSWYVGERLWPHENNAGLTPCGTCKLNINNRESKGIVIDKLYRSLALNFLCFYVHKGRKLFFPK